MNIKHNKLKNTGILFELLVRRIASDVLDGKPDSFAISIVREHFHPKSELGKELQLYRSFFAAPKLTEGKAFNMLDLIMERRKTINEKLLNAQKFLLIKEIRQQCDIKQFLSGRVPSYKVYASIYKLFETATKDSSDPAMFMNIEDVMKARFMVVEHLKGNIKEEQIIKESSYTDALRDQDEEIRYLSYKILLERFNEKYSNFNDKQKQLLREYINNGTDIEKFNKFVATEAKTLMTDISKNIKKIKNEVTRIKINEVISQLKHIQTRTSLKENHVTALLIAYQISHELSSLS